MNKITPFLWFDDNAEEAINFYLGVFPDSQITQITYSSGDMPQPKGSVLTISFKLADQEFTALNGGPAFSFNEAVSFVVTCDTQDEIDRYWEALTAEGTTMACGWLRDKYGLAWQIVPLKFFDMIGTQDAARTARVLNAMNTMIKFDIAALEAAYADQTA